MLSIQVRSVAYRVPVARHPSQWSSADGRRGTGGRHLRGRRAARTHAGLSRSPRPPCAAVPGRPVGPGVIRSQPEPGQASHPSGERGGKEPRRECENAAPESAAALLTVWGGTRRGLAGHATTGQTPWFRVWKSGDGVEARCRRPRHGAGSQPGQIGWRLGGGGPRAATGREHTRTGRPRSCAAPTVTKLKLYKMHVRHCSDCTSLSFRESMTGIC